MCALRTAGLASVPWTGMPGSSLPSVADSLIQSTNIGAPLCAQAVSTADAVVDKSNLCP